MILQHAVTLGAIRAATSGVRWAEAKAAHCRGWLVAALLFAAALLPSLPAKAELPGGSFRPYQAICFEFFAEAVNLNRELPAFPDIRPEVTALLREANPQAGVVAPIGPECIVRKDITGLGLLGITVSVQREGDTLFFSFARSMASFPRSSHPAAFARISGKSFSMVELGRHFPMSTAIPRLYVNSLPATELGKSIEHILATLRRLSLGSAGRPDGPPLVTHRSTLFLNR